MDNQPSLLFEVLPLFVGVLIALLSVGILFVKSTSIMFGYYHSVLHDVRLPVAFGRPSNDMEISAMRFSLTCLEKVALPSRHGSLSDVYL